MINVYVSNQSSLHELYDVLVNHQYREVRNSVSILWDVDLLLGIGKPVYQNSYSNVNGWEPSIRYHQDHIHLAPFVDISKLLAQYTYNYVVLKPSPDIHNITNAEIMSKITYRYEGGYAMLGYQSTYPAQIVIHRIYADVTHESRVRSFVDSMRKSNG